MSFDAATCLSAVSGGCFVAVVVGMLLKSRLKEIPELKREVSTLRDDRVAAVEADVKEMKRSGCSVGVRVLENMKTVIAQNNQILLDVGKLNRESATQEAVMKRNSESVKRLHARLDDHVEKDHGR